MKYTLNNIKSEYELLEKLKTLSNVEVKAGNFSIGTQVVYKNNSFYFKYHSGKNSYLSTIEYNNIDNSLNIRNKLGITDYILLTAFISLNIIMLLFFIINNAIEYFAILAIVQLIFVVIPHRFFAVTLKNKSIRKFIQQYLDI